MKKLDYDNIIIDKVVNIIGVAGSSPVKLLFDSHIDHITVNDIDEWKHEPYSGDIENGKLYGRASSDMKSSLASMNAVPGGCTIYIDRRICLNET